MTEQILDWLIKNAVGVLALLVALLWNIPRKSLSYDLISVSPLIRPVPNQPQIKVLVQGKEIVQPSQVRVELTLEGNRGIQDKDYNQVVKIFLAGKGLEVKAASAFSSGIQLDLSFESTQDGIWAITLPRTALNPKQSIDLQVITEGNPQSFWITGHILDCSVKPKSLWSRASSILLWFVWLVWITTWLNSLIPKDAPYLTLVHTLEAYVGFTVGGSLSRLWGANRKAEIAGVKILEKPPDAGSLSLMLDAKKEKL